MNRTMITAAQRIVKKHGGRFAGGEWNFATVESVEVARELVKELENAHYQVLRPPVKIGNAGWQIIFR